MRTNGNGAHPTRLQEIDLRALDAELHGGEASAPAAFRSQLDDAYAVPAEAAIAVVDEVDAPALDDELVGESDPAENLRRYARWQARDFLRTRAVWLLPLAILALWIFRDNYDVSEIARNIAANGGRRGRAESEPMLFRTIVLGLSAAGAAFGSLIATFGIVARDRERGLQRFLFAKPVSITRYYLQALAINGVGLLTVVALTLGLTSVVFLRPVPFFHGMMLAAFAYVLLGGFSFLLSTLVRFDFAAAGVLSVLSFPVWGIGERWRYPLATVGRWLLPPVPALAQLVDANATVVPGGVWGAAVMCLAYGAAYIAGALAVLRRRSITT